MNYYGISFYVFFLFQLELEKVKQRRLEREREREMREEDLVSSIFEDHFILH